MGERSNFVVFWDVLGSCDFLLVEFFDGLEERGDLSVDGFHFGDEKVLYLVV